MCYFYALNFAMKKLAFYNVLVVLLSAVLLSNHNNIVTTTASTSKTEINFIENGWDEAIKQASARHKYIFVDAYATWCGPCKMLRNTTFKNKQVAEFFNDNFVNVSMDVEKGKGVNISNDWNIQSIPTLVICNANGKPLLATVGYVNAAELLKFGKAGLAK